MSRQYLNAKVRFFSFEVNMREHYAIIIHPPTSKVPLAIQSNTIVITSTIAKDSNLCTRSYYPLVALSSNRQCSHRLKYNRMSSDRLSGVICYCCQHPRFQSISQVESFMSHSNDISSIIHHATNTTPIRKHSKLAKTIHSHIDSILNYDTINEDSLGDLATGITTRMIDCPILINALSTYRKKTLTPSP